MIKDINFDLVGNLISKMREKNGLTQQELADEIGVSKGAISQWEKGAGITTNNLFDIAQFFNITVNELIEGQLVEEEDEEYFERNYNLDEFDGFDEIDDSNYDDVLEYLKRCKNVIKRFMDLFFLDRENKLTKKQMSEFNRLSRYFVIDYQYANTIGLSDIFIESFKRVVEEVQSIFVITDSKQLDYILFKLYYLKPKVKAVDVFGYEKSDVAAKELMELNGKEFCDKLLTDLVDRLPDQQIEKSLAIKRLIENGARCFYTRSSIGGFVCNEIDEETFKHIANSKENSVIKDRYDFFTEEEKTSYKLDGHDPYYWKNYTKAMYEYLIDEETTNRVRDLVLLKSSDPQTYYKNMIERDAKHLEAKLHGAKMVF